MTLGQWLQLTLGIFPESVQQHLRQEYSAHYQDHLEAGGPPDALALFGSPAESQKKLKKLYLTQVMLNHPKRLTGVTAFFGMWVLLSLSYWLITALSNLDDPYALAKIAVPMVSLLTLIGLWVMTRQMVAARRGSIRHLGLMLINCLLMLPDIFLSPSTNVVLACSIPFTMLCILYQAFETDRRIRRTLRPGPTRRT